MLDHQIAAALKDGRFMAKCAREQVETKDLRLLNPAQWLNDEVINFYMAMLQERANNDLIEVDGKKKKRRDIHCFNSFFYAKLEQDYTKSKIGRWTKQVCLGGVAEGNTSKVLMSSCRSISLRKTLSSSQSTCETSIGYVAPSISRTNDSNVTTL